MTSLPIWTAGLWRCCIVTIRHTGGQPEGATVACAVCGEPLRVRNGAWESASFGERPSPMYNARIDSEAAD